VTRRVALLGKPLKRRHSQVMHDAAFDAAGIDARYLLLELEPDEVEPAVAAARGEGWLGLGVTAPYKQVVAALVDEVEADAATIGAVNNVVRTDDGRLIGINTDAPGFRAGAELAMGRSLAGLEVVVVGAGGVAHAVVFECLQADVLRLTVANRNPDKARTLLKRFDREGRASRGTTGLDSDSSFHDLLFTADLVVNATTVGMIDPGVPFPVDRMDDRATVFDCVYVPAETPLVAAARARGLRAANGSEMLIQQAAIAFERWTGVGGMAGVMRTAVKPLLADPTVRA
jgi:shikimate dehydrogenase